MQWVHFLGGGGGGGGGVSVNQVQKGATITEDIIIPNAAGLYYKSHLGYIANHPLCYMQECG